MDYNDEETGLAFAIPDLYGPSRWLLDVGDSLDLLFTELKLDDIDARLPEVVEQLELKSNDTFFSIPNFGDGPGEVIPAATFSDQYVEQPPLETPGDDYDIWLLPAEESPVSANIQSWDSFDNAKLRNPSTPYFTEAGADIFDALVEDSEDSLHLANLDCTTIHMVQFLSSIFALGLGRSSILFTWDDEQLTFKPTATRIRISGHTVESISEVLAMFYECGNITKALKRFVDEAYTHRNSQSQIAFAEAVSTLLSTVQSCFGHAVSPYRSILQLQALFKPVHSLLTCFARIVKDTAKKPTDESILSTVYEEIQRQEHRTDDLRAIIIEILRRVSRPWLEFVSGWLGLQPEVGVPMTKTGLGKGFVAVAEKEWVDEHGLELQGKDFVLDYGEIPSFVTPDDARAIFEVGRSLRILRCHHPGHALAKSDFITSANPPSLEWKFSWYDVLAVESRALKYEQDLREVIKVCKQDNSAIRVVTPPEDLGYQLDFFGKPEEDMQAKILASIATFNKPMQQDKEMDQLSLVLERFLVTAVGSEQADEALFAPPVSLAPLLGFNPIIAAQARIINATCMRMFFKSHNLRQHLSIQRTFHLFGNGCFTSRLSHALFDPDMESAERHRGVARAGGVMGLRLGGRETWPPASSELRLALMGVLTECYTSSEPLHQAREGTYLEKALPGDLSFAVRDMSEAEIDKCTNADSLEALDFLRLSYKPPSPLEAVITPIILFKYDQIFKLLLRIIRMLYVVSSLFKDARDRNSAKQSANVVAQRFRIEAQHFVSCIASYFFDTGIECTWSIFENKLDEIEARIDHDDDDITLGQDEGLEKLREYHERVLDRIMFVLLLRKRQQPVMQLLEEILTLILEFSKLSSQRSSANIGSNSKLAIKELYTRFARKVGVFITVCRGLSEKKGYGDMKSTDRRTGGLFDGNDLEEENTVSQLLGRLEMSGYYAKWMTN